MTVTGEVADADLGKVLVHEHVKIAMPGWDLDIEPPALSYDEQVAAAVDRMRGLAEHGVRTFVDPVPIELGRDPLLLRDVAQRSGMNIVCATGFYHETDGMGIPYYWRQRWSEEIAELYIKEITAGIGDTGIRPGVIKAATGVTMSTLEERVLRAAALAAAETGLPVITHTTESGAVLDQLAAFADLDPARCLIGHQDQQRDYATLRRIVEAGFFVGFDRIGLARLAADTTRADHIARLVEDGFLGQICLSQDHWCFDMHPRPPHWVDPAAVEEYEREVRPDRDIAIWARPHTYIFTDFIPLLTERGLGADELERIFVANPRRLLTGA